ncbi:MAG: succinate dehydrogenase, cytochrome b556 subunit [Gammaproteobacteria bacterium]|nr:succinate dehydrogenase, cytochrome b556 subunit [Gammaproteobacteria bacterium]
MSQVSRPLSPHLQVYRWQISNTLSILHRLTGTALALGGFALVAWLLALASGQAAFTVANALLGSLVGQLALLGWTFCFFYHLCNGVRHLAWDAGHGFDKALARKSGIAVVTGAVLLTVIFWAVALTRVAA